MALVGGVLPVTCHLGATRGYNRDEITTMSSSSSGIGTAGSIGHCCRKGGSAAASARSGRG